MEGLGRARLSSAVLDDAIPLTTPQETAMDYTTGRSPFSVTLCVFVCCDVCLVVRLIFHFVVVELTLLEHSLS